MTPATPPKPPAQGPARPAAGSQRCVGLVGAVVLGVKGLGGSGGWILLMGCCIVMQCCAVRQEGMQRKQHCCFCVNRAKRVRGRRACVSLWPCVLACMVAFVFGATATQGTRRSCDDRHLLCVCPVCRVPVFTCRGVGAARAHLPGVVRAAATGQQTLACVQGSMCQLPRMTTESHPWCQACGRGPSLR